MIHWQNGVRISEHDKRLRLCGCRCLSICQLTSNILLIGQNGLHLSRIQWKRERRRRRRRCLHRLEWHISRRRIWCMEGCRWSWMVHCGTGLGLIDQVQVIMIMNQSIRWFGARMQKHWAAAAVLIAEDEGREDFEIGVMGYQREIKAGCRDKEDEMISQ